MKMKTIVLSTALALAPAFASASSGHDVDANMAKMEAHMKAMEGEMQAIRSIKDPTARKQAMENHMQGMMEMMHGMHAMPVMSGSSDVEQLAYLSKRVDLLQAMMDQMVQSRAASYGVYPGVLGDLLSGEEYKGEQTD